MRYILKWLLFSLAFVPLFVNFDTLFPFIFTKTLLIRSAITLFWIFFAIWYFRERNTVKNIFENSWRFFKNPLFIAVTLFIALMLLSTIFAENYYKAFFGDIERGEGFLGILHFFSFFIASLLVFKKEDWVTFFRLSLVTGAILLVDSIGEISSGEFTRAQSLIGNPTFLAGYFLFVIFSAMVAFFSAKKQLSWRIFSFLMIFGGIVGVFLTGTRGAILGLFAGSVLSVLYFAIKGRDLTVKLLGFKTSIQKISIALLVLIVLGMGVFVSTRDEAYWQKVPGIDRFATLSLSDPTLQTRLISAGVSIDAVNPADNGLHRLLIGYGPDNFNIAYNKYFNPEYLKYENLWFDRAHNKVFDILVMNGILGLLAYGSIWFFLFFLAFKRIREKEYAVPIIFFGSAYFVQNIFVFDQISTWIPFFALLGFAVFIGTPPHDNSGKSDKKQRLLSIAQKVIPYKLPVIALAFSYSLIAYVFVPYFQSIAFVTALRDGNAQVVLDSVEDFSTPYTYAQATIRTRFLQIAISQVRNPELVGFVNTAIALQTELLDREPYDPRDSTLLGNIYRSKGNIGEPGAYEKAAEYLQLSLELSPTRQEHLYALAGLAADQRDFSLMQEYIGRMYEMSPDVARTKIFYGTTIVREGSSRYPEALSVLNTIFDDSAFRFRSGGEILPVRSSYELIIKHFFEVRDKQLFADAARGARDFEIRVEGQFGSSESPPVPLGRLSELEIIIQKFEQGGFDAIVIDN